MKNVQVLLARRPVGPPVEEDFRTEESEVPLINEGEALLQNQFISLDAGFRNWMNEDAGDDVLPAMAIDAPVMGLVAATVLESKRPDLSVGQIIVGRTAWETYSIAGPGELMTPIQEKYGLSANYFLGVMGDTGLSAYFGLDRVASLKAGETVLISAAGGAVGNAAGQIAKAMGAGRVVGFAGSEEKCRWLEDKVGYDAAINYKAGHIERSINEACPDGIDVYFDNVGGELLEPVLNHINYQARIPFCGAVADYAAEHGSGPANLFRLVANSARLEGFMTHYWMDDYETVRDVLAGWLSDGSLVNFEARYSGVESCGKAYEDLFAGNNFGKAIVVV